MNEDKPVTVNCAECGEEFEPEDCCEDMCLDCRYEAKDPNKCSNCGNQRDDQDDHLCRDCRWWTAGDRKFDEDNDR